MSKLQLNPDDISQLSRAEIQEANGQLHADPDGLLPLSKAELKEVCLTLQNRFLQATERIASLTQVTHLLYENLDGLLNAYERKDFDSLCSALDALLAARTGNLAIMKAKNANNVSSVRR